MTSLLSRSSAPASGHASPVTELPQVNLLPPEVRSARSLRRFKRLLALVLVAALGACAAAYLMSARAVEEAQARVDKAQTETATLLTEQAKYAEVPVVLGALDDIKVARLLGMAPDVLWRSYLDAVATVLPPGVSIDTVTVSIGTGMAGATDTAVNPLGGESVGQIQFVARSLTVFDTVALLRSLETVPGLGNVWASSVTASSDPDFGVFYASEVTVQITAEAFSGRFLGLEEEE